MRFDILLYDIAPLLGLGEVFELFAVFIYEVVEVAHFFEVVGKYVFDDFIWELSEKRLEEFNPLAILEEEEEIEYLVGGKIFDGGGFEADL